MVSDPWPNYRCPPRVLARSPTTLSSSFCKTTVTCLLVILIISTFGQADAQANSYASGNESGSCRGEGGEAGQCTFALFCLLSGGQSRGSCGSSLFYTCCAPRLITIRQSPPAAPSRRQPPAVYTAPAVSYPTTYHPNYQHRQSSSSASSASTYQYPQSNSVSGNSYPRAPRPPAHEVGRTRAHNDNSYASFRQRIGYIVESCGKPIPKPQSRIVGGQDALYGEFPWQAHIKISRQQCGGALVSAYFVLTAAHCVYKARLSDITIILGAYDIQDQRHQLYPAHYIRPVEKIIHPYFRFSPSHPDRYDVALLRLEKAIHFQDHILPICLPPPHKEFQGWRALVTGWGKTDPALSGNRYGTRLLQKVDVPIIANEECERWHRTRGINLKIYPEMMCAGYEVGLKDACVGDSGGPLITYVDGRWTLVGVTSAGFGCAQSRQPGIYHRVPTTVDWIYTNIY